MRGELGAIMEAGRVFEVVLEALFLAAGGTDMFLNLWIILFVSFTFTDRLINKNSRYFTKFL